MQFWSNHPDQIGQRSWTKLFGRDPRPVHLRSSYKWVTAIEQGAYRLQSACSVTHVMDREADDIKVLMSLYPKASPAKASYSAKQHFVLRCKDDRWVTAHMLKEDKADTKALKMSQLLVNKARHSLMKCVYKPIAVFLSKAFNKLKGKENTEFTTNKKERPDGRWFIS